MEWRFKLQILPKTNSLLGFSYQSGEWEDSKNNIKVPFKEFSIGIIFIVAHIEFY